MAPRISKQRKAMGERFRTERERLGYSQKQIAQLMGVPEKTYAQMELGQEEPGLFTMPQLVASGFDIHYIVTDERLQPVQEESELLRRFRDLSLRGRNSIFMTLDALERLAPNLKTNIRTNIDRIAPLGQNIRTNIERIAPNLGENIRSNIEKIAPNLGENIRTNIEKIAPNLSENIESNIRNIKKKLNIK